MKEVVIFCAAYPQIENALYVAMHNCHNCSITIVIPAEHNLFRFFKVINERLFHNTINIVHFEIYQGWRVKGSKIKRVIKRLPHVLPDILRERRYLKGIYNKYFAELRGAQVFFFSRYFSSYTIYLLKKLSQTNRLVYMLDPAYDVLSVDKFTPTNIVGLARLAIMKLTFGHDIVMGKLPYMKRGFSGMPDEFIEKEVDRVIDREERNEMMKDFDLSQFKIFDVGNYSVIYFDERLGESSYIADKDAFGRELAEIFAILSKYFPEEEIAYKHHPEYEGDKTVVKIGNVIEPFIPAELLYNDNVKMYLSIISASIANVEKGLAVSLMDLVTFKNDKIKEQLKEILIQRSRSEILFPQSLDEFEKILIDIKQQRTSGYH